MIDVEFDNVAEQFIASFVCLSCCCCCCATGLDGIWSDDLRVLDVFVNGSVRVVADDVILGSVSIWLAFKLMKLIFFYQKKREMFQFVTF